MQKYDTVQIILLMSLHLTSRVSALLLGFLERLMPSHHKT